jgi:predicted CXXCH cytochrome family protein
VKKLLVVLMALTLVAGFSSMSYAQSNLTGSSHDFSGDAWNTKSELCNVCHAPHNNKGSGAGPLWNHEVTGIVSYTPYTDSGSGTLQSTPGDPGPVSKLCFGCHDGVVAVDNFGGGPGTPAVFITGTAVVDDDLSDDHPIGFTYDVALSGLDPEIAIPDNTVSPGEVGTTPLPLFGATNDLMECSTCHDVHDNTNGSFLRMSNSGSGLCLNCHTK